MDENDFREFISTVELRLSEIGASELADEGNYVFQDPNTGEERLLDPKQRLLEMLLAFDRYMAVRDGATFQDAMGRIRQNIRDGFPQGATFVPVADTLVSAEANLSNVPNLSEVRLSLEALFRQIHDEPLE